MESINKILKDINHFGRLYREEQLAPLGISSRQGMFLHQIGAEPGISQEQLTQRIGINKSNVARAMAAMEEEGFIERRCCGKDKRVLRLYLTEKASALLPHINQVMASWEQLLVESLTPTEQQVLEVMLQRLRTAAMEGLG